MPALLAVMQVKSREDIAVQHDILTRRNTMKPLIGPDLEKLPR
jgi:hypothetical protein